MESECRKAENAKSGLCIMMIDIDYFKQVNDRFGHQTGDKILINVSELIMKNLRESDYIGRYGGEEFLVILPGIEFEAAVQIAEKIRKSMQDGKFRLMDTGVTISTGLAQYKGETKLQQSLKQQKSLPMDRQTEWKVFVCANLQF